MSEFKVGDVVRLKSWSPPMVIAAIDESPKGYKVAECVSCAPETLAIRRENVPLHVLEPADPVRQ